MEFQLDKERSEDIAEEVRDSEKMVGSINRFVVLG